MAEKQITSAANPIIKKIKALALKKNRDEEQLFIAEGLRHITEAIENGWEMDLLAYTAKAKDHALTQAAIQYANTQKATCLDVDADVLTKITQRENSQSVIAVFKQRWHSLADVAAEQFMVGLDNIRDPGNLGTILRTGDATGLNGVILIGATCDPYSPEAIRASMGSFARSKLVKCTEAEFIAWSKAYKGRIIGTHLNATEDYRGNVYEFPLLLLMGNEQNGLSDALGKTCSHLIRIPMQGTIDSLNLSIATGLMLYEVYRQKIL